MHISSTYKGRCRHRRTALLLLWAFTLQWILPLEIAAKQLASLSSGTVMGAKATDANLAPEPLPEIQAEFVRQIPLLANDVVYSASTGKLYASVPSSAGSGGNSIATIDPVTGAITNSVFIGSEPNKLALSDDGHTLYVSLDGAFAVRRFDTLTQTAGAQFALGRDSFNGVYSLNDLAVAPGNPNLVAVARAYRGISPPEAGVAVFENGVRRTQTGPGHSEGSDFLAFSASASKLYGTGFYSGLKTLTIDSNGVTVAGSTTLSAGHRIKFDNGRIYGGSGQVINPDTSTLVGTFSGATSSAFVPDSSVGRAYYLVTDQFGGSTKTLKAFDINTFLPVGTATLSGISGDPTTLIRWGSNGLAFRTSNNQLFIVQTSLIPSPDPIPTPTVAPSPTPTPSPAYFPTFVRRLELPANDMVISQATGSLYASVPSIAGANGNSITKIVPETGVIGPSVFIGSEPGKLALSDNGQTLYASLNGANAIRRFDIPTETPGPQFSSSPQPVDMDVLPGNPNSIAISKGTGSFGSPVRIYDDGVARPNASTGSFYSVGPIEFGSSAATLYGYDSYSSGFELVKFAVNASGLTTVSVANNVIVGYNTGLKYSNGLLYSGSGRVVDPELQQVVGTFPSTGFSNVLAVDAANGRAYYISSSSTPVLSAYDINTFLPLGSVTLNGVIGTPVNLMRWGTNGLAFSTIGGGFSDPTSSRVYLLQTALVSAGGTIPTGIQFSSDKYNTFEGSSLVSLTVTRSGDVSAATSVNYATSDGTATAGADYTAANGTINFNAGETSKNISIPLLDDNIYEGPAETFSVALSSPSGTAVLVSPSTAVVTIGDSESKPVVGITSNGVSEGNSGTTQLNFTLTLSNRSFQTVTVDYTTVSNSATAGSDYVAQTGTVSFEPGSNSKTLSILVNGDMVDEPDETFFVNLSNAPNAGFISPSQATGTIFNDDGPPRFFFATSSIQVSEGVGQATISVTRAGRSTSTASINFATQDGSARQTSDYTVATGTLVFSPGQVSRSIRILINDDAYVEGTENVTLVLSNPNGDGAILGTPNAATLFIQNNDFGGVSTNPIDDAAFFVRAHYSDFLGRVPDDEGFAYWTAQITNCGSDAACIRDRRVAVSNAFFYEQEYQQTASYVFLLYRAAYGDNQPSPNPDPNLTEARKLPRYLTFVRDRAQVVGGSDLAQSQLTLANAFVQRPEFVAKYPASLSAQAFVDAVLATIQTADGAVLTSLDRDTLVAHLNTGGRGMVMFHLANDYFNGCERLPGSPSAPCVPPGYGTPVDNRPFLDAEYTRSFVYSQYSGYLRRDAEMGGFLFWLNEVNKAAPRNPSVQRAMVCSFVTSAEYQHRFNLVVTRTNAECP